MDTFVLHLRRQSGLVAAVTPTKVIIDGEHCRSIKTGQCHDYTLPRKRLQVMLLIPVALGKDIEKTVTIDPRDSVEVTLLFTFKFNPKILLPFGAFTQPQSSIETEIIYGPAVATASSSAHAAYTAPRTEEPVEEQHTSATSGEKKFCTECGTPNPKSAKFCQGCGNKF